MYDRSNMHRAASYSHPGQYQPPAQSPPKNYPTAQSTSSAFSASANPNEDWTKISDLAERRRIQNRIAQRNYRKKLKKRLEDLERRAGSNSASPEPKNEELPQQEPSHSVQVSANSASRNRSNSARMPGSRTPEVLSQQYVLPSDDRGMFSQQYTRQLSTSPPPFSYATLPATEGMNYPNFPASSNYCAVPVNAVGGNVDISAYPQYLPPMHQQYAQGMGSTGAGVKQEFYPEDEMSPFSMSYASMAGVDVASSSQPPYQDVAAYTPPLLDSFEFYSKAGSPGDGESMFPRTPASMPRTPPMHFYAQS